MVAVGVVAIVALLFFSGFFSNDETNHDLGNSSIVQSKPVSEKKRPTKPSAGTSQTDPEITEETEFLSQKLNEELEWIAQVYEAQAKYPVTSLPVQDPALARSPQPFEQTKVDMRLPDENGNLMPISLSAAVDRMQYFTGDTIIVQLTLSGLEGNESVSVETNIKHMGRIDLLPSDLSMTEFGDTNNVYQAKIDTNTRDLPPASHELLAKISVEVDEKSYVTTVPFFLSKASAVLDNVALSRQEGAFLHIPLEYSVTEAGYYFVSAFLDDAATGQPLLALQAEGRMRQGNDQLVLKAHQQALKDAGSPGPYRLRVMKSFRGAEPGEGNDVPTAISQSAYAIPAYAFENYDDIPFSDPAVKERLDELKSLTGKKE